MVNVEDAAQVAVGDVQGVADEGHDHVPGVRAGVDGGRGGIDLGEEGLTAERIVVQQAIGSGDLQG
ncbi:hypothetical protein HD597_007073 [Nonomuraea thailandensis]|uniref:Uncharacterized protein n=1 Tax=Nonomuraea thailandensis TaxID=1188745 RepID=A0A9X2K4H0_9ACTN|nr:hypothetical protein [Nonomuraea thailandensis]MCP2360053.1 hypothetical protein [Nonomuraea thailandensis]